MTIIFPNRDMRGPHWYLPTLGLNPHDKELESKRNQPRAAMAHHVTRRYYLRNSWSICAARQAVRSAMHAWWTLAAFPPSAAVLSHLYSKGLLGVVETVGSDNLRAAGFVQRFQADARILKRFAAQGLGCLWQIAAGRGRKPIFGAEQIKAVVDATLQTKPKEMTP